MHRVRELLPHRIDEAIVGDASAEPVGWRNDFGPLSVSNKRANVLIEGTPEDVTAVLGVLTPGFHEAVSTWPDVPTPGHPPTTLVVRDVGTLSSPDLAVLDGLLERRDPHTQIVCTSAYPLYEAVQQGTFPSRLYYRLNVVLVSRFPFHDTIAARGR